MSDPTPDPTPVPAEPPEVRRLPDGRPMVKLTVGLPGEEPWITLWVAMWARNGQFTVEVIEDEALLADAVLLGPVGLAQQ